MILALALKKHWFDLTKDKIKLEDYREITPYWCNRLLLINGESKSKNWWNSNFFELRSKEKTVALLRNKLVSFKPITINKMTLGYPKKTDLHKNLLFRNNGLEIRIGLKKWGAKSGKIYFVIKHGEQIKNNDYYSSSANRKK